MISFFGWIYILLFSDCFVIHEIVVSGLYALDADDVRKEVYVLLDAQKRILIPLRHAWFINERALAKALQERLFAESVSVDKSVSGILRLFIKERTNQFILHSRDQFVFVNNSGMVEKVLNSDDLVPFSQILSGHRSLSLTSTEPPIIRRDLDDLLAPGYSVGTENEVRSWINVADEISSFGLSYREIEPAYGSSTLARVVVIGGYRVLLEVSQNIGFQIRAYNAFVKSMPKSMKVNEFVDVHIPGKIFVK